MIPIEIILRHNNIQPGFLENYENFEENKKLIKYPIYSTDEDGIFKLSYFVTDTLQNNSFIDKEKKDIVSGQEGIGLILNDFYLLKDSIINNKDIAFSSAVSKRFFELINDEDSETSKIYREYIEKPFNNEGFRGLNLESSLPDKKKIMLIGDSFVWGMSANPIYQSFYDILLSRGYMVYNFGIIGTDPAQYEAIAKKYIPILKPDIVIVNFFVDNDLIPFQRTTKKDEPLEVLTNFGFVDCYPLGEYMPVEEALDFYSQIMQIPKEKSFFNSVFAKTSITSSLWELLYELGIVKHEKRRKYETLHNMNDEKKAKITSQHFSRIEEVCQQNEVHLINAVIPSKPFMLNKNKPFLEKTVDTKLMKIVFGKQKYYYYDRFCMNDFEENGYHFNNSGALKYADFLEELIELKNPFISINNVNEKK